MAHQFDPHESFDKLLERYWLNEAGNVEIATVEKWLAEHPKERVLLGQLHQGIVAGRWTNLTPREEDVRVARILEGVRGPAIQSQNRSVDRNSILRWDVPQSIGNQFAGARGWLFSLVAAAAVVLAVLNIPGDENAKTTNPHVAERGSVYTASNGERATVYLPDGSTVMLNVGTRLEVPAGFGRGQREVFLEGEALFTVEHKKDAAFQVRTSSSSIRVLGTSFVVREYAGAEEVFVAVREGRVAVGKSVVAAHQQLTVESTGQEQMRQLDPGVFSFERGVLTLSKSSLREAVDRLNRWYNVELRFGDQAVGDKLISGNLAAGSPSDLIEYLKLMYDIRAERSGRVVTLYSGGETQ